MSPFFCTLALFTITKINHFVTRASTNTKVLKGISGMVMSQKLEILKNMPVVHILDLHGRRMNGNTT